LNFDDDDENDENDEEDNDDAADKGRRGAEGEEGCLIDEEKEDEDPPSQICCDNITNLIALLSPSSNLI